MVDINGKRCEVDCCETGDNPNLKVLQGNSLCVGNYMKLFVALSL